MLNPGAPARIRSPPLPATRTSLKPTLLLKPRHRHLAEFVIAAQTEADAVRDCLVTLRDGGPLLRAFQKALGGTANEVALRDAEILLKRHEQAPCLDKQEEFSKYDLVLLSVIGEALVDGYFVDDVIRIICCTDLLCGALSRKLPEKNISGSDLFADMYAFGRENSRRAVSNILAGYNLRNKDKLSSLFDRHFPSSPTVEEFVIGMLGKVGDGKTIEQLESFTENADLGRPSIEAIKKLKAARS